MYSKTPGSVSTEPEDHGYLQSPAGPGNERQKMETTAEHTQLYPRTTSPCADGVKLLQQLRHLSDLLLKLPFDFELFQRIAHRALERLGFSLSDALAVRKFFRSFICHWLNSLATSLSPGTQKSSMAPVSPSLS